MNQAIHFGENLPQFNEGNYRRADRLRAWFEARPHEDHAVDCVISQSGFPVDVLYNVIGDSGIVFAPVELLAETRDAVGSNRRVMPMQGSLKPAGGEVFLFSDASPIETESYATAPYVSITSPTALSISDAFDTDALMQDVSVAIQTGVFPDHLTSPVVTIQDLYAWLNPIMRAPYRCTRVLLGREGARDGFAGAAVQDFSTFEVAHLPGAAATLKRQDSYKVARFFGACRIRQMLGARSYRNVSIAGYGDGESAIHRDPVYTVAANGEYFVIDVIDGRMSRVPRGVADVVTEGLAASARGEMLNEEALFVIRKLGLEPVLNGSEAA